MKPKNLLLLSFFLLFFALFLSGRDIAFAADDGAQYLSEFAGGEISFSDDVSDPSSPFLEVYNDFCEGNYPIRLALMRGTVGSGGQLNIVYAPQSCSWEDIDYLCLVPFSSSYTIGYSYGGNISDKFSVATFTFSGGEAKMASLSSNVSFPIAYMVHAASSGRQFFQITSELELVDDENPEDWQSFITPSPAAAEPDAQPEETAPSSGASSGIPAAVASAFQNVKGNVDSLIVSVVPYALFIIGTVLAVLLGIKFFKKLAAMS